MPFLLCRSFTAVWWWQSFSGGYAVATMVVATAVAVALAPVVSDVHAASVGVSVRYDDVHRYTFNRYPSRPLRVDIVGSGGGAGELNGTFTQGVRTTVMFSLPRRLRAPVWVYYQLTNVFQNFLRFRQSRSFLQFDGEAVPSEALAACIPYRTPIDSTQKGNENGGVSVDGVTRPWSSMMYNPCGIVAWSVFNDTFVLSDANGKVWCDSAAFDAVGAPIATERSPNGTACRKRGISWKADLVRYRPPSSDPTQWTYRGANSTDPFLARGWYLGEVGHKVPNVQDLDVQVWMRTGSTSTFRKLWRIIDEDMPPGNYTLEVDEFFDVTSFLGQKHFVMRSGERTWFATASALTSAIVVAAVTGFLTLLAIARLAFVKIYGSISTQL